LFSLLYSPVDHRDLHSFPTRRSSDLLPIENRANVQALQQRPLGDALCELLDRHAALDATDVGLAEHELVEGNVPRGGQRDLLSGDRKSTRLNSSHDQISYAVFCLKKK